MGAFDDLVPNQSGGSQQQGAFADLIPAPKPKSEYGRTAQEALGVAKGISDPFVGASQLVMRGLNKIGVVSDESLKTHEDYYNDLEKRYQEATPEGSGIGRVVGNVAATIPLALTPGANAALGARVAAGMGTGAASSALNPVNNAGDDFWKEKAKQVGIGLLAGGAAPLVGAAAARVVSPQTSEAAKQLLDEGVRLTPGQVAGGALKRVEEGLSSVPILGDSIKSAQRRGIEDFNRAVANRVLAPIGKKVGQEEQVGYEMIDKVHQMVSQNYDELLPKLNPLKVDNAFDSEMSNLLQMSKSMHPDFAQQFDNIMQNEVFRKFTPAGTMSSASMKEVESELGKLGRRFGRSQDGNSQMLGDAFQEAQSIIRNAVERQNPAMRGELKKANMAWAELLRAENASSRLGAKEGIFTPSQYEGAVKALSSRKSDFGRGKALGQDFATAAESTLSNKVPDSGTPFRAMLAAGTVGAGTISPAIPIAAALGGALYTSPAQKALVALMTKRPDLAPEIAKHLKLISGSSGLAAPALSNSRND